MASIDKDASQGQRGLDSKAKPIKRLKLTPQARFRQFLILAGDNMGTTKTQLLRHRGSNIFPLHHKARLIFDTALRFVYAIFL